MKKLLLFLGCTLFCAGVEAQPMITGNTAPVKLSDVVANYKQMHPEYGMKTNTVLRRVLPGLPKEKDENDYQFDRWLWYWRQYVDGNGYLVSPMKTWQEWEKQKDNINRTTRTTSSEPLGNWGFQGPDSSGADGNGVGRINVIAFHPTDVNTYWIGSPGGGAWETKDNGATWTCKTDQLPLLSVTDIKYNPLNPNTIYLCTGDRDGQDYYSVGLLKSYDGGNTWGTTGLTWTPSQFNITNSLLVNPLDTNSLILATTIGMMRSFDGGATWANVGPSANFYQVVYNPYDTNVVYATTFSYFGSSAQIYRSANAGMTWTQVTSFTQMDRISVAVTPADPSVVKALCSSASSSDADGLAGIYSSSDTGHTFTEIYTPDNCNTGSKNLLSFNSDGTQCGGQGFYDLPIAISLTNKDSVYIGGVNTFGSGDGGATWHAVNQWTDYYGPGSGLLTGVIAIHADKHFIGFNPLAPGTYFETNDGGIYSTTNPPSATGIWNDLTNGLGITEIYRTAVSNTAHYQLLGAQDVGSKMIQPGLFQEADGGDGMVCQIDFADTTIAYTSVYNGYIDIQNPISVLNPQDISQNILGGTIEGTGGWITPFVLEPSCHTCILAAYGAVYRSTDMGTTWSTISPSLITGSGYGDLLRVVTTLADANTIYVAEDGTENIFYTHDLGTTWTTITAPYGSYANSDIKVDPRDKNHIWVTFTGYGSPQVAEWSLSGGWTQINAGLPDVPVDCIEIDTANRDLYVGTEIGVYFMDTTMTSWVPYTYGMPSVKVTDLEINYGTNEIWAATFGRSLWKSQKHITTSVLSAASIVPFTADGITISPNPNHGNFTVTVKNIADRQVSMRLTDNSGKMVWHGTGMLKGSKLDVNIQGLIAGTYIFEIGYGNTIEGRQKLVINQ